MMFRVLHYINETKSTNKLLLKSVFLYKMQGNKKQRNNNY